jgi:hypothetical protein
LFTLKDQRLVAAFQQNALQRLNAGDPAEVPSMPYLESWENCIFLEGS